MSTATTRTRAVPLPEVARAAHQGPGGARSDKQHVKLRELAGYGGRRGAVVCPPVARVGVLVEPDVAVVGGAQGTDVIKPRAEEAARGIRLGDDVHLGAQRLHQQPGRQVAAGVGHAHEPVALARRDDAQRHPQVPRRGLDQDRPRRQRPVPVGGLHHLSRGLQLDRAREVKALTLQEQRTPEDRTKVYVEIVLVEGLRNGYNRHDDPSSSVPERSGAHLILFDTAELAVARRSPPVTTSGRRGSLKPALSAVAQTSGRPPKRPHGPDGTHRRKTPKAPSRLLVRSTAQASSNN